MSASRKPKRRWNSKPYTMLAVTFASARRVLALSAPAKLVLLYAHTSWRPGKPILLPVRRVAEALGRDRTTIADGIRELLATGLIERTRDHVRPGKPGAARGRCAEYRLPHRPHTKFRPGEEQLKSGVFATLDPGDEKRVGYVKVPTASLLSALGNIGNTELQVLWAVGFRDHARDKHGAVANDAHVRVNEVIPLFPAISERQIRRAVRSLTAHGLLREIAPAAGRRSAVIAPAGFVAAGLPWQRDRRDKRGAPMMVDTWGQPNVRQTIENGPKPGDRFGFGGLVGRLACLSEPETARCRTFGMPVNNPRPRNECLCLALPPLAPCHNRALPISGLAPADVCDSAGAHRAPCRRRRRRRAVANGPEAGRDPAGRCSACRSPVLTRRAHAPALPMKHDAPPRKPVYDRAVASGACGMARLRSDGGPWQSGSHDNSDDRHAFPIRSEEGTAGFHPSNGSDRVPGSPGRAERNRASGALPASTASMGRQRRP